MSQTKTKGAIPEPNTWQSPQFAQRFRDAVNQLIDSALQIKRPQPRMGFVQDINRVSYKSNVLLNGDDAPVICSFTRNCQPNAIGDIVRVQKIDGAYWIDEVMSVGQQMARTNLNDPNILGGDLPYTTAYYDAVQVPLPSVQGNFWHIGRWESFDAVWGNYLDIEATIYHTVQSGQIRKYQFMVTSNMSAGNWRTVIPTWDTGDTGGCDFDLECMVDTTGFELRIRRTRQGGLPTPGGYYIALKVGGGHAKRISDGTGEGSGTAPVLALGQDLPSNFGGGGVLADGTRRLFDRMDQCLVGGGVLIWDGTNIDWLGTFTVRGIGLLSYFQGNGFFNIDRPANGTVIPVHGNSGVTTVTQAAAGIPMPTGSALYYDPNLAGQNNTSIDASFHIVSTTQQFLVPGHWLLVAQLDGGASGITCRWGNGVVCDFVHPLTGLYGTNVGPFNTAPYQLIPTYTRDGIWVQLEGLIVPSANLGAGATLFTLPVGYRPAVRKALVGLNASSGTAIRIDVQTTGITITSPAITSGQAVSLDNMRFRAGA